MQLLLGLVLLVDHVSTFEWHIRTYVHNHMLIFLRTLQLEALATSPKRHQVWLWLVSAILTSTSWNLTRLRGPDLVVRYIMARLNCYVGPPRSNPTGKIAMQQVTLPRAMHRRVIRGLKIGLILVAGCNFAKRLKRNVAMMLWGVQYNFPVLTSVGLNKCDNNRSSRLLPIAWPCLLFTCDYPVNT